MRCFVAITPPEPVIARLGSLAASAPVGRATPAQNLHLTLAFLGEVPEARLPDVNAALAQIRAPTLEIAFGGLDLFGGAQPQILFATVRPTPPLEALHRKIAQAVRSAGIDLRRERFRPHVTLTRFNRGLSRLETDRLGAFLQAQPLPVAPPFRAETFELVQSVLGVGPARHSVLAEYDLGPAAAP